MMKDQNNCRRSRGCRRSRRWSSRSCAPTKTILNSYGWVDPDKGTVRIPIDQAIDIVAQKGLPSKPSPAGLDNDGYRMIPDGFQRRQDARKDFAMKNWMYSSAGNMATMLAAIFASLALAAVANAQNPQHENFE